MSIPVDLELKKAFGELQLIMQSTSKKIFVIDNQIELLSNLKKHIEMLHVALQFDINSYETVGRMFLLTDVAEIKNNLQIKMNHLLSRITELEESKKHLDKNLKESQANIREMVQQRKEQSEKST